ncbi:hypothetical protein ACWGDE_32925 [Streptomyces sp. NPDC054956]
MRRVHQPSDTPQDPQPQPPAFPPAASPARKDRSGPVLLVATVSAGACAVLYVFALVLDALGHAAGAIAAIPTGGVLTGIVVQLLRRRS